MDREETYYQAMLARDYRFDGKFFVGVKTTGIYCRPVCPAKPKRENVEFFPTAHLAEKNGYRPCLRCRPESAPQSPAWSGKSALVQRALKAIADQEYPDLGETGFAERFGVSARHLRRLFEDEIGKSPKRILLANRLDFARKLIVETSIPMGEIAFSSGFTSVRRFNDAIKERFKRSPTRLRGRHSLPDPHPDLGPHHDSDRGIILSLPFRPPFDWDASLAYYRLHGIAGLESFAGGAYERLFLWGGAPGLIRVTPGRAPASLSLQVIAAETRILGRLVRNVRRMFDLDSDPILVANAFAASPRLARLLKKKPGLRAPRGWDAYETAICSILGQLVSIEQANRMITRLLRGYGDKVRHPITGEEKHLFPTPQVLAESDLDLVGTTGARKAALRDFCGKLVRGEISLHCTQDPERFRASLLAIKGIGPWTAEYISLRCIADTNAFPATDLILKRAVEADPEMALDRVRPWRGYAAAYLWNEHASALAHKEEKK